MDDNQVKESVLGIVSDLLGKPVAEIKEESKFIDDLGADSLDNVELVMALEQKFGIEIPDEKSQEITTVGEAIKHISEHLSAKE